MDELIRRKDAIEALGEEPVVWMDDDEFAKGERSQWQSDVLAIKAVPTADKQQGEVDAVEIYERAKRQLERGDISLGEFEDIIEPLRHLLYDRPTGVWTNAGFLTVCCSNCGSQFHELEAVNYCPACGAEMECDDDDYDYERAVEMAEHERLYEPTYNPEDGSM